MDLENVTGAAEPVKRGNQNGHPRTSGSERSNERIDVDEGVPFELPSRFDDV